MSRILGHPQRWRVLGALLFAAVATGVEAHDAAAFPVAVVLDEVAEGVAETVEQRVDATVAQTRGNGRHLGFDTNVYPGDRAMLRWKEVEHYDWVGYYLPAPCHKDPSWSGRRETLEEMGWGLAVVYVGQQYWGKGGHVAGPVRRAAATRAARNRAAARSTRSAKRSTVRKAPTTRKRTPAKKPTTTKKRPRRAGFALILPLPPVQGLSMVLAQVRPGALEPQRHTWDCESELLTAEQGRREGLDAIQRTEAEGFPRGTAIYLDIERMEVIPQGMRDYYKAWTETVARDGRYVPAYYAHSHNAKQIFEDVSPIFVTTGVREEPRFWIASGRNFHKGKAPTEVGHEFAAIWQGVLDITEVWGGIRLPIDINVSDTPNPSAPASVD